MPTEDSTPVSNAPPIVLVYPEVFNALQRVMHRALKLDGMNAWEDVAVLQQALAAAQRRSTPTD